MLACVGGLAVSLRLIGIQYGLPAVYNPDEAAIMSRALSFARGTLDPQNFVYPTFYFYVLFVWIGAYLAVLWATGRVESTAAMQRLYFTDPTGIFTAGRALSVACGTASVFLLYRLVARLIDRRTAQAAAVFLAVAPLAVRDAHYVKHDVPATLAVVAAYLAMSRLLPGIGPAVPTTRDTMVAAAICGVAFSTHYYCVFLAAPLGLVVALGWWRSGLGSVIRQLATAALVSVFVFFALSPFILLNPVTAWQDIVANRQIVVDRAVSSGVFAPAARYADMLWRDTAGVPVVILGLIGCAWMLVARPAVACFLLAFPAAFLLFIANTAPASRYLNPVLPFVALFAAWTVSSATGRLGRGSWPALWMVVTLAAAPGLVHSLRVDSFIRQADTRRLAEDYIESTIAPGSSLLIQPHSVALTPSRDGLFEALTQNLGDADRASIKFRLQLSLDPYPVPAYRLIYLGRGGLDAEKIYVDPAEVGGPAGLEPLRRLGVEFVVIKRYNRPDPETLPLLAALAREGRRLAAFSPYRPEVAETEQAQTDPFLHNTDARIVDALERPGPALEIWQIDGSR